MGALPSRLKGRRRPRRIKRRAPKSASIPPEMETILPPNQGKRVYNIAGMFQSTVTTITHPENYKAIAMPTATRQDTVNCISEASFPSEVSPLRDQEPLNRFFGSQGYFTMPVYDQPKAVLGHQTQKARSRSMFHPKSNTLPVVPVFRRVTGTIGCLWRGRTEL